MPDRRMGPCSRFIGGWVNLLAYTYDQIAPFWQTPREVEWAKAAADGLADREAEEGVAEPHTPQYVGYVGTDGVTRIEHAKAQYNDAMERHYRMLFGLNEAITAIVPETSATTPVAESGPAEGEPPEPSAGVGWDKPWPRTCADAGAQCKGLCTIDTRDGTIADPDCFRASNQGCSVSTPCGCPCVLDQHPDGYHACRHGDAFTPSAEVEPPASAPSAESPAPEFDWVTTAIPVIAGVLAEHQPTSVGRPERAVFCGTDDEFCGEFADWEDWRAHVAPHIAIAIQSDLLSTIYEDTTFAINAFSGDRPRPLADFPKHQK